MGFSTNLNVHVPIPKAQALPLIWADRSRRATRVGYFANNSRRLRPSVSIVAVTISCLAVVPHLQTNRLRLPTGHLLACSRLNCGVLFFDRPNDYSVTRDSNDFDLFSMVDVPAIADHVDKIVAEAGFSRRS